MQYVLGLLAILASVEGNPFPQAVTAAISPSATAPAGCSTTYSGTFGIAVVTAGQNCGGSATQVSASSSAATATVATEYSDGQPEVATTATTAISSAVTATVATEYSDGQPEVATTATTAISSAVTATVATEFSDGQPEVPTTATTTSSAVTATVATEFSDGQPEVPTTLSTTSSAVTATVATEYSDGQPEVPTTTAASTTSSATTATATVATEYSDGQPEVPTSTTVASKTTSTAALVTQSSDGQPESTATSTSSCADMVACSSSDTLAITLTDGILTDSKNRTGYIASNTQFQFDDPPQAGAIYTAGFSVCSNGSLALGGSTVFYECLSGDFYNLYTTNWAAQCKEVTIQAVRLEEC